jgi:hypothetical protein
VAVKSGVGVRCNCNIFNLDMENVLKGLPDKISCPDIIHKCTSNVHIFLITFKLRDTGTCFIQKIYAPSSSNRHLFHSKNICPLLFRKRKSRGHIFFE